MRKIRTIDAFMDGNIFVKVVTKNGYKELLEQITYEDCEAMDKICDEYKNDFETNHFSSAYYLTYYKKQHALKAMCSEFFEKVYNSGVKSPYVLEM